MPRQIQLIPIDHMMELASDILDRLDIQDDTHEEHLMVLCAMVSLLNVDTSEGLSL